MARRNIKIDLRLNESEAAMLNRDVEKSGLSREAYLRHLSQKKHRDQCKDPWHHCAISQPDFGNKEGTGIEERRSWRVDQYRHRRTIPGKPARHHHLHSHCVNAKSTETTVGTCHDRRTDDRQKTECDHNTRTQTSFYCGQQAAPL